MHSTQQPHEFAVTPIGSPGDAVKLCLCLGNTGHYGLLTVGTCPETRLNWVDAAALLAMLRKANRPVAREHIPALVGTGKGQNDYAQSVVRLRRALGPLAGNLRTVHGVGYKFMHATPVPQDTNNPLEYLLSQIAAEPIRGVEQQNAVSVAEFLNGEAPENIKRKYRKALVLGNFVLLSMASAYSAHWVYQRWAEPAQHAPVAQVIANVPVTEDPVIATPPSTEQTAPEPPTEPTRESTDMVLLDTLAELPRKMGIDGSDLIEDRNAAWASSGPTCSLSVVPEFPAEYTPTITIEWQIDKADTFELYADVTGSYGFSLNQEQRNLGEKPTTGSVELDMGTLARAIRVDQDEHVKKISFVGFAYQFNDEKRTDRVSRCSLTVRIY